MSYKVVRDPVHNLITLCAEHASQPLQVQRLMDTREFQRLRRIRQLGVSWFTYPGAEHSRFVHSLGVYHLSQRIIQSLLIHSEASVSAKLKENASLINTAALLHDIGHGPFSHVFESVFGGPKHEDWTVRILESPDTEIHQALVQQDLDIEGIVSIINRTYHERYAVDIVSSELDADRMDYLLRDAFMTGVEYGSYDVDWLINAMRIAPVSAGSIGGVPIHRLCVDGSKGLHAIEQYVLARLFMYLQVYLHRATRATEALIVNIFKLAADLAQQGKLPETTPVAVERMFRTRGNVDIDTYVQLDDFTVINTMSTWVGSGNDDCELLRSLARMCDALVNRRRPYRCVELKKKADLKAVRLIQHLESTNHHLRYHCYLDSLEQMPYKGILYNLGEKELEDTLNLTLFVLDSSGIGKPIESQSVVLRNLDRSAIQISRLYYDATYEDEFKRLFAQFEILS